MKGSERLALSRFTSLDLTISAMFAFSRSRKSLKSFTTFHLLPDEVGGPDNCLLLPGGRNFLQRGIPMPENSLTYQYLLDMADGIVNKLRILYLKEGE